MIQNRPHSKPIVLLHIGLVCACFVLLATNAPAQCAKPGLVTFKSTFGPFLSGPSVVADVNADGKPDLSSYEDPGKTKISLGMGGGDFAAPTTYLTGGDVIEPDFGDLNGDGKPEMLVNNTNTSTLDVWMNNGSGSFTFSTSIAHTGQIMLIADLNGDGKGDLLSYTFHDGFSVRLGNGAGIFTSAVNYFPAVSPYVLEGIILGDFNGDGKTDVAANLVSRPGGLPLVKLALYLGDGSGAMTQASVNSIGAVELRAAADLNGDGKYELVGVTPSTGTATIMINGGTGTFTPHPYTVNASPSRAEIVDFDGDGKRDVLIGYNVPGKNYTGETILFGDGAGGVASQGQMTKPSLGNLRGDFDGDGKLDYLDVGGNLFTHESVSYFRQSTCNAPGDPRRIDYDGDGWTEYALFRPSNGTWYQITPEFAAPTISTQFGASGDVPTPGDFDGDGKTDLAVFRPSTGDWYILRSADHSFTGLHFGATGDRPVPGDYDGDGRTDVAIYRPSSGAWYMLYSGDGSVHGVGFGISTDVPVPTDFDGDGKADVAVFRPSEGNWYMILSTTNTFSAQPWGSSGDIPVAADYDGDGRSDVAVFRPATGVWYVLRSYNSAMLSVAWGQSGDIPVPGFVGGANTFVSPVAAIPAVYRPSNGYYYSAFIGGALLHMGTTGDLPVSAPYLVQ